jgi:DNA helicase HerA-like ATPase
MLGEAYRQYGDQPFGINQADRLLHLYVIGQTGTGKSTLLHNMALQDARAGVGFCLIDPHGDLAMAVSARIDREHIYWNVADPSSPYGYNPITRASAAHRPLIASGLIDTLKKQWADSWGARMEHLLRYAILALLEQPRADIRDIIRLYIDKEFRRQVIARISDEQVRHFWSKEFPNMNYVNAIDGVAPIANKLGAFLAHPVVRRAVCEPAQPLRFRQIMDEGGILIINLAKGRLGSDIANVLGGLIVANIMNAALSRTTEGEAKRRPFMLYVDEFHSFTTMAFADMLPEARKYGLSLTLAHQHLSQTEREVFGAIIGNAGSVMAFRLGASDAPLFERQLGDVSARDLVNLPNHHCYTQLMVEGRKTATFSTRTWPAGI